MTEAQWLACNRTDVMVDACGQAMSQRKKRLLACACCRRAWGLLDDPRCRTAVEASERHADGPLGDEELVIALRGVEELVIALRGVNEVALSVSTQRRPALAAYFAGKGDAPRAAHHAARALEPPRGAPERLAQANLLRDIVGNPFRTPPFDPAWLTPTVTGLAAVAYEERALPSGELDTARLAVLADALEDAGCTDPELLTHLRGPGPHVRGCWALDLILGKQ
jgi:hypothetical protein